MPSNARKAAAPGLKLVMTTAALAGTLAGWAGMARKDQATGQAAATPPAVQFAPLPTLVAPPTVVGAPDPGVMLPTAPALRRVSVPAGSGGGAAAPAGAPAAVTVTRSSR